MSGYRRTPALLLIRFGIDELLYSPFFLNPNKGFGIDGMALPFFFLLLVGKRLPSPSTVEKHGCMGTLVDLLLLSLLST